MKFGLIYEIERPRRAGDVSLADGYRDALEQVKIAEASGFDCVWSIEPHLPGRHAPASAPEMWLAAVAQHSHRIRIGQGVRVLPFGYNNPIRVAEMAAVLDIMSEGRLDFGTGRMEPGRPGEAGGGGLAHAHEQWDEVVQMIPKMWIEDEFSWDSEHFAMPPRNVLPKPVQDPHPPLWMWGSGDAAEERAGERGLGFMNWPAGSGRGLADRVSRYREAIGRARSAGAFVNEGFAQCTPFFCASDDDDAETRAGEAVCGYVHDSDAGGAGSARPIGHARDLAELTREHVVVGGGPEACAASIEWHADQGIDIMLFLVQPGSLAHEDVCDSLRRFGREVLPRFVR